MLNKSIVILQLKRGLFLLLVLLFSELVQADQQNVSDSATYTLKRGWNWVSFPVLQTELLNSSPYLSNDVLETATDKEDVLTNPLIRDVLVANPQSAKNEEVLELIENRVNPMPQYMKDQIISGQALISAKEQMEAELHYYSLEYNNTLSMLVAEYSNENGENYSINNLKQMLANAHNREARYQLAGIYLNEGNAQAMSSTLNSITSDFTLNQEESQELGDMVSYFNLVTQLKAEGRKATDLTSSEIDELMSLYENSENKASVYARNLLLAADQIEYEAPVIFPDMGNKSTLVSFQANNTSTTSEVVFMEVYPNPAKDYIIFEYDIDAEFSQAQLLIYQGVKGELLQQTELKEKQNSISIGVKDWAPGTYIASIQVDDKLIKSIKFTIAK